MTDPCYFGLLGPPSGDQRLRVPLRGRWLRLALCSCSYSWALRLQDPFPSKATEAPQPTNQVKGS